MPFIRPVLRMLAAAPAPAPAPAPAVGGGNWLTRSTGASVVWAHNFDYDAEVTNHLLASSNDPTGTPVEPRRVVDSTGIGCLETVYLGATLTANYTAGGTTIQINDATYWPTTNFYFMVCGAFGTAPHKNLFLCSSRSGLTLTVTRSTLTDGLSSFSATAQSYVIGDYAGNESTHEWRRVFSALPATENGLPTADPAASGTVPLRSRLVGDPLAVPRDASLWQYGWYGHPSNQATWANWTPWTSSSGVVSYQTPRGVAQGAQARFRLWDGSEFFLQFRIKIDPRFFALNVTDPTGEEANWVRKSWALQSENTSLNQLVASVGTSNKYHIPSTVPMPFYLQTHKAVFTVGSDDWARPAPPAASHYSHQAGSPWDVAPYYAGLSQSGKPSTGCPTPDGSAAWEWKDNEWITFYVRVKPGRATFHETEIEVKFARTEDLAYDNTYTTLLSVTDALIPYSGQGDEEFPDGLFDFPTTSLMTALPGYQSFGLMGYLNIFQTDVIVPPKGSYYIRMGQVILSKAAIAAPLIDVLPTYVPAANTVTTLTVANGKLANTFNSQCAPYFEPFYFNATGSTWGGCFKNPYWGVFGGAFFGAGGHGNHNDNSLTVLEYGATQMTFKRVMDPTPIFGSGTDSTTKNANSAAGVTLLSSGPPATYTPDIINGVSVMDAYDVNPPFNDAEIIGGVSNNRVPWVYDYGVSTVGGKMRLGAAHTYGSRVFIGPSDGGAACGTFLALWNSALNRFSQNGVVSAIAADFSSTTAASSTTAWYKHSTERHDESSFHGTSPILTSHVGPQRRTYMQTRGGNYGVRWYDEVALTYVTGSGVGFDYDQCDIRDAVADGGSLIYVPSRNLLLCCYSFNDKCKIQWMDVSVSQPTLGGTANIGASFPTTSYWGAITWCTHNNRLIAFGTGLKGDLTKRNTVFEIEIPTTLTDAWPMTEITVTGTMPDLVTYQLLTGVATDPWQYQYGKRTEYDPGLRSIVWYENRNNATDTVYIYRPRNT